MSDNNLVQECVDFVRTVVLKSWRLEAGCAQDSCRGSCPPTLQQPLLAPPIIMSCHVMSCHALGTVPLFSLSKALMPPLLLPQVSSTGNCAPLCGSHSERSSATVDLKLAHQ